MYKAESLKENKFSKQFDELTAQNKNCRQITSRVLHKLWHADVDDDAKCVKLIHRILDNVAQPLPHESNSLAAERGGQVKKCHPLRPTSFEEKKKLVEVLGKLLQQASRESKVANQNTNCERPHLASSYHPASSKSSSSGKDSVEVRVLSSMLEIAIADYRHFEKCGTSLSPHLCRGSYIKLHQITTEDSLGSIKSRLMDLCDRVSGATDKPRSHTPGDETGRKSFTCPLHEQQQPCPQVDHFHSEVKRKLSQLLELVKQGTESSTAKDQCLTLKINAETSKSKPVTLKILAATEEATSSSSDHCNNLASSSYSLDTIKKNVKNVVRSALLTHAKSSPKLYMLKMIVQTLPTKVQSIIIADTESYLLDATSGFLAGTKCSLGVKDVQQALAKALKKNKDVWNASHETNSEGSNADSNSLCKQDSDQLDKKESCQDYVKSKNTSKYISKIDSKDNSKHKKTRKFYKLAKDYPYYYGKNYPFALTDYNALEYQKYLSGVQNDPHSYTNEYSYDKPEYIQGYTDYYSKSKDRTSYNESAGYAIGNPSLQDFHTSSSKEPPKYDQYSSNKYPSAFKTEYHYGNEPCSSYSKGYPESYKRAVSKSYSKGYPQSFERPVRYSNNQQMVLHTPQGYDRTSANQNSSFNSAGVPTYNTCNMKQLRVCQGQAAKITCCGTKPLQVSNRSCKRYCACRYQPITRYYKCPKGHIVRQTFVRIPPRLSQPAFRQHVNLQQNRCSPQLQHFKHNQYLQRNKYGQENQYPLQIKFPQQKQYPQQNQYSPQIVYPRSNLHRNTSYGDKHVYRSKGSYGEDNSHNSSKSCSVKQQQPTDQNERQEACIPVKWVESGQQVVQSHTAGQTEQARVACKGVSGHITRQCADSDAQTSRQTVMSGVGRRIDTASSALQLGKNSGFVQTNSSSKAVMRADDAAQTNSLNLLSQPCQTVENQSLDRQDCSPQVKSSPVVRVKRSTRFCAEEAPARRRRRKRSCHKPIVHFRSSCESMSRPIRKRVNRRKKLATICDDIDDDDDDEFTTCSSSSSSSGSGLCDDLPVGGRRVESLRESSSCVGVTDKHQVDSLLGSCPDFKDLVFNFCEDSTATGSSAETWNWLRGRLRSCSTRGDKYARF